VAIDASPDPGLPVFTLASLACACAPTLLTLSIARVIQGPRGRGHHERERRAGALHLPAARPWRALGINAFVVATCAALGPTIASAVLAVAAVALAVRHQRAAGVITILIAIRALPDTERTPRPLNYAGAALYAGTFGLLLSGLQSLAHHAATALALVQIGCGCGLGWLLARHELPRAAPLIPSTCCASVSFPCRSRHRCARSCADECAGGVPFEIQRLGHSAVATACS